MELVSRMQLDESEEREERLALSTVTASRRLQFCAGHRVYGHESKCANLHGHNYVVFLYARSENELNGNGLDSLGRVVDFGQLKSLFAPWIEANWDHGFIVSRNDLEAQQALNMIPGQKLFVMENNPTAENMARYILLELAPRLLKGSGVRLTKVVLWETENCFAEVELV